MSNRSGSPASNSRRSRSRNVRKNPSTYIGTPQSTSPRLTSTYFPIFSTTKSTYGSTSKQPPKKLPCSKKFEKDDVENANYGSHHYSSQDSFGFPVSSKEWLVHDKDLIDFLKAAANNNSVIAYPAKIKVGKGESVQFKKSSKDKEEQVADEPKKKKRQTGHPKFVKGKLSLVVGDDEDQQGIDEIPELDLTYAYLTSSEESSPERDERDTTPELIEVKANKSKGKLAKGKSKEKLAKGKSKENLAKGKSKEKLAKGKSKENLAKGKSKEKLAKGKSKENLAKGKSKEKLAKGKSKEKLAKGKSKENLAKGKSKEKLAKEKSKKPANETGNPVKENSKPKKAASKSAIKGKNKSGKKKEVLTEPEELSGDSRPTSRASYTGEEDSDFRSPSPSPTSPRNSGGAGGSINQPTSSPRNSGDGTNLRNSATNTEGIYQLRKSPPITEVPPGFEDNAPPKRSSKGSDPRQQTPPPSPTRPASPEINRQEIPRTPPPQPQDQFPPDNTESLPQGQCPPEDSVPFTFPCQEGVATVNAKLLQSYQTNFPSGNQCQCRGNNQRGCRTLIQKRNCRKNGCCTCCRSTFKPCPCLRCRVYHYCFDLVNRSRAKPEDMYAGVQEYESNLRELDNCANSNMRGNGVAQNWPSAPEGFEESYRNSMEAAQEPPVVEPERNSSEGRRSSVTPMCCYINPWTTEYSANFTDFTQQFRKSQIRHPNEDNGELLRGGNGSATRCCGGGGQTQKQARKGLCVDPRTRDSGCGNYVQIPDEVRRITELGKRHSCNTDCLCDNFVPTKVVSDWVKMILKHPTRSCRMSKINGCCPAVGEGACGSKNKKVNKRDLREGIKDIDNNNTNNSRENSRSRGGGVTEACIGLGVLDKKGHSVCYGSRKVYMAGGAEFFRVTGTDVNINNGPSCGPVKGVVRGVACGTTEEDYDPDKYKLKPLERVPKQDINPPKRATRKMNGGEEEEDVAAAKDQNRDVIDTSVGDGEDEESDDYIMVKKTKTTTRPKK